MMAITICEIRAHFQEDGTLIVETTIQPVTPKLIGEIDLRQKIVAGIATTYLDHFNEYSKDPDLDHELEFLAAVIKNAERFITDQRNPKSTENDHEII